MVFTLSNSTHKPNKNKHKKFGRPHFIDLGPKNSDVQTLYWAFKIKAHSS